MMKHFVFFDKDFDLFMAWIIKLKNTKGFGSQIVSKAFFVTYQKPYNAIL